MYPSSCAHDIDFPYSTMKSNWNFRKFRTNWVKFWYTFSIKRGWKNSWPSKEDSLHPSLPQINKTWTAPWPWGPFLRAKIIKSYVYLSVILWVSTLQVSFALFTVLNYGFLLGIPSPKTFTVYQTLAISLLAMFFGDFFIGFLLTIFWHIFAEI